MHNCVGTHEEACFLDILISDIFNLNLLLHSTLTYVLYYELSRVFAGS